MKAYYTPGYRLTILSILLLFIFSGCSLTRGIKNNQALVRKITMEGMDDDYAEAAVNYVDKEQQPNNWLNLQFYYMFSNHGKRGIGEAPRVVDSNLIEFSRMQIERYLRSKGYVKARVVDTVNIKKKRAELVFSAVEGPMFKIRSFKDSIYDKKVRDLYRAKRPYFSRVRPGGRFDTDSLAFDRDEFYLIMKRNGYYDFYRQYINFNYDSTFNKSVVDLVMIVDNPIGKAAHPVYRINNTLITISNSAGRTPGKADTIQVDSQYRFVDFSHQFKPRTVTDYNFQKKGQLFDIDKQTLTTSRLSELNVFRNVPNPTYTKLPDSTNRLNTKIDLVPIKKMSDRVEGEFLFNAGQYGYNLGNTFTKRDLFKQAAILQIKANYSVLFDNAHNVTNPNGIENQDFRVGASLIYPRLITPFDLPVLGRYGIPHTTFSSNYQLFYQRNLVTRVSLINSITYDFAETERKLHTLTPIDIEFSHGAIDPAAQLLLRKNNLYSYGYLIGRTVFTSGSQYTFQYNAIELNSYRNFIYFRGSADVGGNTLALLSKLFNTYKDSLGERNFAGRPFAQYAKGETDVRIYRALAGEQQVVFRLNTGVGVPYGNSKPLRFKDSTYVGGLIFEKNFYAGGASDMRAWLPRTLGPGQFNRASFYGPPGKPNAPSAGDYERSKLKYVDQFGEVKIISNLEYRYKIVDDFFGSILKGAVFMDAGNIWRLQPQPGAPNVEFKFSNIFQSSAMDIGTGLRFDLAFFVFRLDAAFKFKDPQFNGSDQWVLLKHGNELFHTGPFKAAYRTANSGDTYNFMQLNFGIGMPF